MSPLYGYTLSACLFFLAAVLTCSIFLSIAG
ncbi:hypothetical protein SAMN06266787_11420 [Halorubrum ezzemoulense]|uniref:Uncharacterized protein n=1 Tax=Halorubrum ezzemoulense TaxID=337243 RepID=A0A238YKX1_HALEZ|nr:hypothetical protein SAMN06266787_11420 [Halorubrum ezzemoulense]